ncbi:glutaredoxin family protein [Virgibacillus siamensis]|uniref:glutaredoxin family protein n=1 Tax=Virgibacillus siamensis TaxID=480071 RepID=UPI0011157751|nr:glutaredoxin family protein [Virgibacillus siamensis]
MSEKNVIVYVSDDCSQCDKLLAHLNKLNVHFETKNVTKYHEYMEQLQEIGVFGTPATFVNNHMILGMQTNKINRMLETDGQDNTYFHS